ncbi:hypothetical protein TruAng_010385 [Truncatella angustata]|nr:hypothetical protein TruAng_010385 [Truncatella angustata]
MSGYHRSSKSHSRRPDNGDIAWGPWKISKKHGYEYRDGIDSQGQECKETRPPGSSQEDPRIPRNADVDGFPQELSNLAINEEASWGSPSQSYSHDSHLKEKGKGKGKGKDHAKTNVHAHNDDPDSQDYNDPYHPLQTPIPTVISESNFDSIDGGSIGGHFSSSLPLYDENSPNQAMYHNDSSTEHVPGMSPSMDASASLSTSLPQTHISYDDPDGTQYGEEEQDSDFAAAIEESANMYYGQENLGESSNSAAPIINTSNYYPSAQGNLPTILEGQPNAGPSSGGIPKESFPNYNAREDYTWLQDSRFGIRHSNEFQPGTVFKVVWAEPKGSGRGNVPLQNTPEFPYSEVQQKRSTDGMVYTGVRRFIVIASESGSSICVPILTYEGKACLKKGVKSHNHGIIYASTRPPHPLRGEPPHGFEPVKLDLTAEGEKLVKESRINYSKLVTIEHNLNVLFIGSICHEHFPFVSDAVDTCWARRIREQKAPNRKKKTHRH